jgi:hypothetical protein
MSKAFLIIATIGVVVVAFIISTHNYNESQRSGGDTSAAPVAAPIPDGSSTSNDAEMQAYCDDHPLRGMASGVCQSNGRPVPVGQ